ncbi:MazG nucleotide pyrophosphohydrolase domain-containing protein [Frankia sp. Cj3]|uniref:MazG nucleotide pyrophosphohydrolase domain-containing protein n=1 Tax=Frankia sp. Cj3 TaxID=2880976 RepID=UPI001EF4FC2C|nr:MazG nucleotide pyrophosphohydrolase domain-containing protein [Frankia sp. Cj3]
MSTEIVRPDVSIDMAAIGRQIRDGLATAFPPEEERVRQVLALAEEAGEFVQAARRFLGLARRMGTFEAVENELADVILAAYVAAATFGIDIDAVIARTVERVMTREWRENGNGEGV